MTLQEKQIIFASNVSLLLCKIFGTHLYSVTFGEAKRSPEQAAIYAKEGKGIIDSLHCKRLAIDLNLFKDGVYLTDYADYKLFGDYWVTLHPFNRWGGSFARVDSDHFEMQDL
jgi:hypothetical protein